jgi:hypothetical protein
VQSHSTKSHICALFDWNSSKAQVEIVGVEGGGKTPKAQMFVSHRKS